MPIYLENKLGKTFYTVVATAQINGKQVNRKRRSITSIAMAKRVEIELRVELERLKDSPMRQTWSEWNKKCLDRMKLEFKNSTVIGYSSNFNKWVNPLLDNYFLDQITPAMIHHLIYEKIENVGAETKRTILKQIKRILSMAIDEGILTKNPAKKITVKVPESKQAVLNKTEIDTLLLQAKKLNHPFYNHWVLAILTGMRNGELYALNWTDIDFENRVISVTKSWGT
jgi:integrase